MAVWRDFERASTLKVIVSTRSSLLEEAKALESLAKSRYEAGLNMRRVKNPMIAADEGQRTL